MRRLEAEESEWAHHVITQLLHQGHAVPGYTIAVKSERPVLAAVYAGDSTRSCPLTHIKSSLHVSLHLLLRKRALNACRVTN